MQVVGTWAFVAVDTGGIAIIDVSDPDTNETDSSPTYIAISGNTSDIVVAGARAYVSCSTNDSDNFVTLKLWEE